MSRPSPCIELRSVSRSFPAGGGLVVALDNLSLSIESGEFLAIVGPSGSGKSTLLGLMAGLERPSSGELLIEGEHIETMSEDQLARLRRQKLGFVFQSHELLPNFTARENVLVPLELRGEARARERADELLREVGLGERLDHHPSKLSGGEQQRVALARAFVGRPSILLADEPTGNLDQATGLKVLELMEQLQKIHGTTLILVTHDQDIAARADRRISLRDGHVESITSRQVTEGQEA